MSWESKITTRNLISPFARLRAMKSFVLVNQEAKADEKQNQILRVENRYEMLPGPLLTKIDYDNNDSSYPIVTTTQRIALKEYVAGNAGFDYCGVAGFTTPCPGRAASWPQLISGPCATISEFLS